MTDLHIIFLKIFKFKDIAIGVASDAPLSPKSRQGLTEAVLRAYKKSGWEFIARFDPGVSIYLHDKKKGRLLLRPGSIGNGTFYYTRNHRGFVAGPSLKEVAGCLGTFPSLNHKALDFYFRLGYIPGPETIFEGIRKIPLFHFLISQDKKETLWRINQVWDDRGSQLETVSFRDFFEVFEQNALLFKRQKITVMLSGGLDSAFLVALASRHFKKIRTVTLNDRDDSHGIFEASRDIARYYRTDHHEVKVSIKDYLGCLSKAFACVEEPVSDMHLPVLLYLFGYLGSRQEWIWHGSGSDEIFGGNIEELVKESKSIQSKVNIGNFFSWDPLLRAVYTVLTYNTASKTNPMQQLAMRCGKRFFFPFLSPPLINKSLRLPTALKFLAARDKFILRELAKKIIPEGLIPKGGHRDTLLPPVYLDLSLKCHEGLIRKSLFLKTERSERSELRRSDKLKILGFELWRKEHLPDIDRPLEG